MNGRIIGFTLFILFTLAVEFYVFYGIRSVISIGRARKVFTIVYLLQFGVLLYAFLNVYLASRQGSLMRSSTMNVMIGMLVTSTVTKIIFAALLFMQDGGRLLVGTGNWVKQFFVSEVGSRSFIPERRQFITNMSIAIAAIPFLGMLYGLTKGKYNYKVSKLPLSFSSLPSSFAGFKVVQISDIHAGSFDSIADVQRGADMINELEPDLILFTGDLVNSKKDEIDPYMDVFKGLKAKIGKFAVLGNHDYYGLYDVAPQDEKQYWTDFYKKYEDMGFELLNNRSKKIELGGESIRLVGVENWGAGRFFPKFGDLDKALAEVKEEEFCILMSHDPTHWENKVIPHAKKIDLTLSGHTHGMQFGVNIPGFKWSPIQYRYKHWLGLYSEADQHLYVNRGFGFLGFPGRVGMWPEISLFELGLKES